VAHRSSLPPALRYSDYGLRVDTVSRIDPRFDPGRARLQMRDGLDLHESPTRGSLAACTVERAGASPRVALVDLGNGEYRHCYSRKWIRC